MRAVRSSFRVLSSLAVSPARPRRRRVPSYRPHRRAPRLQTSSPNPPAPTLPPSSSGAVTDATPCPAVAHQHNSYGPTRDETTRRLRDRRSPPHLACRALLETDRPRSGLAALSSRICAGRNFGGERVVVTSDQSVGWFCTPPPGKRTR